MFDHIGLKVKDLDASVLFYTAALGPLGYEATAQDESSAAFGAKGTYSLWLDADAKLAHSLVHLAFTAGNRAAVDAFYREGLKARGRDNGPPGVRDRKSTRLNSSHVSISYAVFCLKKKKTKNIIKHTKKKKNHNIQEI